MADEQNTDAMGRFLRRLSTLHMLQLCYLGAVIHSPMGDEANNERLARVLNRKLPALVFALYHGVQRWPDGSNVMCCLIGINGTLPIHRRKL